MICIISLALLAGVKFPLTHCSKRKAGVIAVLSAVPGRNDSCPANINMVSLK